MKPTENEKPIHILVMGLVSHKDLGPRVQIEIGECKTQLTAEKAKEVALMILEMSEAATSDSFLVRFFIEKTGSKVDNVMGIILQEFREFRAEQIEKEKD